jgi:hypothetical protein
MKRSKTLIKRSETLMNGHERSGTVNGQKNLGTIKSVTRNAVTLWNE